MIGSDPLAYRHDENGRLVPVAQFDFDLVDRNLGAGHDLGDISQEDVERALRVLRLLLSWVWQDGMKNSDGIKIRAMIICWVFLKELRPMTLTQLACGFQMKKQSFGRWVDQFKRVFKIRTPHMRPFQPEARE